MERSYEIRQDAEYWRLVLDALPAGLSIHSTDGVVLKANKKLAQIYDRTPEALVGRSCGDLFHQQASECPHQYVLESMGQAGVTTIVGTRTYHVTLSVIVDSLGAPCGFTRMMMDLADQPAGKAMQRIERAGTLEQMISGIAHDVGTPLGIISGYSEYLLMRSKAGEPGHKELSTILHQTRRIADSIKQMLDLVRPSSGRADAIGLNGFLTELVDLMGHHLRKAGVKASVSCGSSPPLIYGDAPKLKRAFFNLVINAIEQVGQSGHIEFILGEVAGRHDLVNIVLAGSSAAGPRPDFGQSLAAILGNEMENEIIGPGLSLTREILEGFKAEIQTIDVGERGVGLSINLPVRAAESAGVSASADGARG